MSEEIVHRLTCNDCQTDHEFDHHYQLERFHKEQHWTKHTDSKGYECDRCETCTKRAKERGL